MSNGYLKCHCEHCENPIEYPVESAGDVVRCPHCQLPTPLTVPGATTIDEEVVIGGRMGKFVVGALVLLLLVVVGVAGTIFYVKNLKAKGHTADVVETGGAPSAAGPVPEGEWKKVKPVVAKFQGGYSSPQIKEGRYVLTGMCTECHKIYDPTIYSQGEWDNIARNMRGKAKLRAHEFEDMQVFVQSLR